MPVEDELVPRKTTRELPQKIYSTSCWKEEERVSGRNNMNMVKGTTHHEATTKRSYISLLRFCSAVPWEDMYFKRDNSKRRRKLIRLTIEEKNVSMKSCNHVALLTLKTFSLILPLDYTKSGSHNTNAEPHLNNDPTLHDRWTISRT